jgi:hypothetical protein
MSMPDSWPGVGPVPEPEPEGFYEEQRQIEEERLADQAKADLVRSKELKDHYSGKDLESEGEPKQSDKHTSHSTHTAKHKS